MLKSILPWQGGMPLPSGLIQNRQPVVYVFFGLSGSGKSFLGRKWAESNQLHYSNSDEVRKEIAGMASKTRQWVDYKAGIYSPEFTRKTYDALIERAKRQVEEEKDCVIDATYTSADERGRVVEQLASQAEVVFVLCRCGEEVVKRRFALRADDPDAASDGRWIIYQEQKKRFVEPEYIEDAKLLVIDTDENIDVLLDKLAAAINE